MRCVYFFALVAFLGGLGCGKSATQSPKITVYTSRHYVADDSLYKHFTRETGIRIFVVKNKDDILIDRLATEGPQSNADVLITADAGRLHRAKELGLLQPVESKLLAKLIDKSLRDPYNHWYALTMRARVLVYRSDFDTQSLRNYLDLADPRWHGSILVRKSNHVYNQSLVSSVLANYGTRQTKQWLEGLVANFAREPAGNDRSQVLAVAKGEGDIAIVNSYYLGKMMSVTSEDDPNWQEQNEAFKRVRVMFPDQGSDGQGVHINISGAGVCKYSKNVKESTRFIEFLASDYAQKVFAAANYEYPIRENIEVAEILLSWGDFKRDIDSIKNLGMYNKEALKLMQQAGWH